MPAVDSRVFTGTLRFSDTADMVGAVDFSCQPRAVSVVPPEPPTVDSGTEPDYVLCGEALPTDPTSVDRTTGWTLQFTAVQDFEAPAGLQAYAFDNDNTAKYFELVMSPTAPTWKGQVTVYALTEGGDVKVRITADASWPITGKPDRGAPAAQAATAAAR